MRYDPVLPKIDPGVLGTVSDEISGNLTKTEIWVENMHAKIKLHDPVLGDFIQTRIARNGAAAVASALIIYRIFETQIEVDQLNEQGKL